MLGHVTARSSEDGGTDGIPGNHGRALEKTAPCRSCAILIPLCGTFWGIHGGNHELPAGCLAGSTGTERLDELLKAAEESARRTGLTGLTGSCRISLCSVCHGGFETTSVE